MSAPDGVNDANRLVRELLDEWEAAAEIGWARPLSADEARLLLAELSAAREKLRAYEGQSTHDELYYRAINAEQREHDLREEALAQEANLWNIITHARTWIPTNRRAAYREAYRAKFKTVARSASSPAATEDEACTYCGATPDGATTPGCPVCEGVIETPAAPGDPVMGTDYDGQQPEEQTRPPAARGPE